MLKRSLRLAIALLCIAGLAVTPALAGGSSQPNAVGGAANENATSWFVELTSPPTVKGTSKAKLKGERDAFYANAAAQGLSVKQRHAFDTLWNGVSVDVSSAQAGSLATVPGVKAVYPVVPMALPPIEEGGTADPDLRFAIGMTFADVAQNSLGLTGKGVKVAIMDSGLDYTLPEFGSCGAIGGTCRVAGGFDFVGDDYDANEDDSTFQPIPHPDNDPAPCDPNVADERAKQPGAGSSSAAHGTHVAGIVGADGRSDPANLVTGVAPDATLYAYRVFGCNGSTDSDIMAAAMQRAADDHVQVLNMSIGAALNNFPNYPTAVSADSLADAGVVVVASIGNSGDTGLFSAGAPGVANKVIGVASVDNIKTFLPYFTVSADAKHVGYTVAAASPDAPTTGALPLAQTGNPTVVNDACPTPPATVADLGSGTYTGKAVLIRRGGCGFYNKALAAQRAGAAAVILYNNAAGRVNPTVAPVAPDTDPITIPVVAITAADGAVMSQRITAGPTTLTWTADSEYFDNSANADTGGRTSTFSSWGTASDLSFKPDITAPGGNIRSTWPHQQHGGHWVISGTSMSSPHVAGAVALYLQAHPGAGPAAVRTALQNTAKPVQFTTFPQFRDSTARQGAGMLDIATAAQEKTAIAPSKIALGDQAPVTTKLTFTNSRASAVTYNLTAPGDTVSPGQSSNPANVYPFAFALNIAANTVTFSSSSVTVPAGGQATVDVTITPDATLPAKTLYGGWIVATNAAASSEKLRVPYLGFKGDYQALVALGNGGCNLPLVARFGAAADKIQCTPTRTIDGLVGLPNGGTFDRPKQDPVIVLYHMDHQAANVTLTLVDAATGQAVTKGNRSPVIQSIDLHPRNSALTGLFAFVWDGTVASSKGDSRKAAPGGVYKLKITVTKVKSFNDTRAAATEAWTSPAITLRDA